MKRTAVITALALAALLCVFSVFAAGGFSAPEVIRATKGETVKIVYSAENAAVNSLGVKYIPAEGFEFKDGDWAFEDKELSPELKMGIEQEGETLHPAVCAFSELTTVNGAFFELELVPLENAKTETDIEVQLSYLDDNMENQRETITVKVVLGDEGENPEDSAAEGSQAGEKDGSGSTWIWIAIAAAVVVCAVCAVLFIRKKKSK
ncbi:MAG: hypothetical protein IJL41_04755 [Clostridia bacterium]|nr:hypothetical protein [Clostridia bacterium]